VLFLLAYAAYVWREMTTQEDPADEETLEPLKFRPRAPSPSFFIRGRVRAGYLIPISLIYGVFAVIALAG
jgi:cation:H+ antiporter